MNKLVASVGLAALGASSVQAADVEGTTATLPKPWSVSATLRGFYDDNLNTSVEGTPKQDVFGFEVSPALTWQWASPQTHISLGYIYSFKYYDHTPSGQTEKYDQTHSFSAALEHAFSERHQLVAGDSFVIGQEPDFLRAGNSMATFQRIPGSNMRNYGSIAFKEQFSRLFGIEIGYNNAFYDYSQKNGSADAPSAAGTLNRIEHTIHLDGRWTIQPETIGIFGYQFRWADYTANEEIGAVFDPVLDDVRFIHSKDRNYREHYIYLGLDHTFKPELTGSLRVGGRYIEFYNDPTGNGNGWGPYGQLNLAWTYAPESRVEVGISEDISPTDITGSSDNSDAGINNFTSSQETTVVYASIHHRITARLRGSIIGQFQNGSFNGGVFDGKTEQDYLVGLNLTYQFNPHISTEVGYNYDKLSSQIGRSFDRNRVYIGVTAGY
jgi:hypothetical protein